MADSIINSLPTALVLNLGLSAYLSRAYSFQPRIPNCIMSTVRGASSTSDMLIECARVRDTWEILDFDELERIPCGEVEGRGELMELDKRNVSGDRFT